MAVRPKTKEVHPRNVSIGPVFDIVAGDRARMPVCLLGLRVEDDYLIAWGKNGEKTRSIEDIAAEIQQRVSVAYGIECYHERHVEPIIAPNSVLGKEAKAEAIEAVLAGPDGPGRRFLRGLKGGLTKKLAESMTDK